MRSTLVASLSFVTLVVGCRNDLPAGFTEFKTDGSVDAFTGSVGRGGERVVQEDGGASGGGAGGDVATAGSGAAGAAGSASAGGLGGGGAGGGGASGAGGTTSVGVQGGSSGAGGAAGATGAGGAMVSCAASSAGTRNLIVNGNAEAGTGSADGTFVPVPGWTSMPASSATAVRYGVAKPTAGSFFPTASDAGPVERGANLFYGGANIAETHLVQTIDLTGHAAKIDACKVPFTLSGYIGGYLDQVDHATVTVELQAADGALLSTAGIGPVTRTDRGDATALLPRSAMGTVPPRTRRAVVTIVMQRGGGEANDGYADNLSLVLTGL